MNENLSPISSEAQDNSAKSLDFNSLENQYRAWFIGDKFQKYYAKYFSHIELKKSISGFNFGAFFFGPIWMIYRKMYVYGLAYFILITVFNIVLSFLEISAALDRGISIGISVALAMSGNTLYRYYVDQKVKHLIQSTEPFNLENMLKQQGGTAFWVALCVLIITLVLLALGLYLEE